MDTADRRPARPFWARAMLNAGRTALTLAVFAAAAGAGVAGYAALSERAAATETPDPAPLTAVAADVLRIEHSVTLPRRFVGQFEAPQEVALGFEEGGTIAAVLVREGDSVARGAVIARLDTRLLEAETARLTASRAATAAEAELARRTHERNRALVADGHVTQQRIDETSLRLAQLSAALAEIDAALSALEVRISKAVIRAPFAGRVGVRHLDDGAVAAPGAGVVTLLEDGPARFRVALDPALALRLAPGVSVEIETANARLPARLAELAPELDPATRSRLAFFDLAPGADAPPARATGEVVLSDTRDAVGAWVPLSALRQGPQGVWTLLTLTDGDDGRATVAQEAAEILHLDEGRAFVRGSFEDGTRYLPAGTHRVVPGETVRLAEAG